MGGARASRLRRRPRRRTRADKPSPTFELGGRSIGTTRLDDLGNGTGVVRLVSVAADLQRQGHGRVLSAEVESYARRLGVTTLLVNAAPDAIGWYDKLGWHRHEWDSGQLTGIAADCVQMRKLLSSRDEPSEFGIVGSRILVIGNSGAGKSTVAQAIARSTPIPIIDLDLVHWEGDGYGVKRDEDAARLMVEKAAAKPRWIIEGVFGWLAAVAARRATTLIWLDLPWSICHANLEQRGLRRGATPGDHAELIAWAEAYWDRQTSSSFAGHLKLFTSFSGFKLRFNVKTEIDDLLLHLRPSKK